MATVKPAYSGAATAFTITLASLTTGSYRQGASVDNSTNLYEDIHLSWVSKSGASGTSATGFCNLYLVGYDGTAFTNNASGSDASYTVDLDQNLFLLYTLPMVANATTYRSPLISFLGALQSLVIPQKWSLIVLNSTSGTLDSTGANHVIQWQGINRTVA